MPSVPPSSPRPALTLREVAAFFLPLIFMAQLMMITHTVIHAWLARGGLPTVALAAFSIAFAINALLSSVLRPIHQMVLGFGADRRSVRRVWHVGMAMALPNMALIWAVALTPLGDWIYGGLLGAGDQVVHEARMASLVLALIYPFQCTRNVAAGLLMLHRRTILISYGTFLRVAALGGFLVGLSPVLHGAQLGGAALVGCIAVEAAFVLAFTVPHYRRRPAVQGDVVRYGAIVRFSWPLIANAMLENGLVVLVNVFLGRLAQPDLALASFGVARGLLMLMMSPLRNLAQTAQALTRTRDDLQVMLRFARLAIGGYVGLIAVLFYTPMRGVVLGQVMGLAPVLEAAVTPAVLVFVVTPPLWALAALYRGLLAGARRTGVLAVTGGVRLGAVVAVAGAGLFWPQVNGALLGVAALAAAFGCESALLGRSLHRVLQDARVFAAPSAAPPQTPGPLAGPTAARAAGAPGD